MLGQFLVDRNNRSDHAAMGIFDAHQIEHALHTAILTRNTVERVEDDIRSQSGQHLRNIAVHIDAAHLVAHFFKRISNAIAAHQRNRSFVGPATHEDCNMDRLTHFAFPTRSLFDASA